MVICINFKLKWMKNYVFIEKWKTRMRTERVFEFLKPRHVSVSNTMERCLVKSLFLIGCTLSLGACTDIKGFTNMEPGPYAKGPEVLKLFQLLKVSVKMLQEDVEAKLLLLLIPMMMGKGLSGGH